MLKLTIPLTSLLLNYRNSLISVQPPCHALDLTYYVSGVCTLIKYLEVRVKQNYEELIKPCVYSYC